MFSTLENSLRGTKFESKEELRHVVAWQLREMSRDGLQHVFESWWVERWEIVHGTFILRWNNHLGTWIKSFLIYQISFRIYWCTLYIITKHLITSQWKLMYKNIILHLPRKRLLLQYFPAWHLMFIYNYRINLRKS
jgi:hypothetical protein